MFESTSRLAAKLISAGAMRNERYLEVLHLDPPLITAIYVRIVAFRWALRKIRESRRTTSFVFAAGVLSSFSVETIARRFSVMTRFI
jgi:hypothetical protein